MPLPVSCIYWYHTGNASIVLPIEIPQWSIFICLKYNVLSSLFLNLEISSNSLTAGFVSWPSWWYHSSILALHKGQALYVLLYQWLCHNAQCCKNQPRQNQSRSSPSDILNGTEKISRCRVFKSPPSWVLPESIDQKFSMMVSKMFRPVATLSYALAPKLAMFSELVYGFQLDLWDSSYNWPWYKRGLHQKEICRPTISCQIPNMNSKPASIQAPLAFIAADNHGEKIVIPTSCTTDYQK